MKRLAILLALAACGDDPKQQPTPDAPMQPMPDAPTMEMPTFTSYVIDLVKNQTADNTQPKPYADFSSLPDPDQMNGSAYSSLF